MSLLRSFYVRWSFRATTSTRTLLFSSFVDPSSRSCIYRFPPVQPFILRALCYMILALIVLVRLSLCYLSFASFVAANASPPSRSLFLPFHASPFFSHAFLLCMLTRVYLMPPHSIYTTACHAPQLLWSFPPKE